MRNDTRIFPEKGLVEDLRTTAHKIAELTNRSMAEHELPEETVELFARLVQRAESTVGRINSVRQSH